VKKASTPLTAAVPLLVCSKYTNPEEKENRNPLAMAEPKHIKNNKTNITIMN
jgi:hypothetical protein